MPSPTRTPDPPAAAGQDAPPGPWLIAVPAGWPPYDCDRHGAACPAAREAAAAYPRDGHQPAASVPDDDPAPAGDVAVRAEDTIAAGMTTAAAGRGITPGHAPGLVAWLGQFAQVIVEILAGYRPAKQLVPWTTERVRAQIDLLCHAHSAGQPPTIRRVMMSQPAAGVAEVTMVVGFGSRSRALAMRFEYVPARRHMPGRPGRPDRWLCTEIETG